LKTMVLCLLKNVKGNYDIEKNITWDNYMFYI